MSYGETWKRLTDVRRCLSYPFDPHVYEFTERRKALSMAAFGGGLNSTAYLTLLKWLGLRPDAILFADTGGEKPETYANVARMSEWCVKNGMPEIVTVRRKVDPARQVHEEKYHDLESECIVKESLPSIAYYGRSCSEKWKQQPQNKWAIAWPEAQAEWKGGRKVVKVIGYDADEARRAKIYADDKYVFWYPLLQYDWGRQECVEAVRAEGLEVPPKSSCFFCPEMKPHEILELRDKNPDLLERALKIESNAKLTAIKGLGKHKYSWRELLDGKVPLPVVKTVEAEESMPCNCYDGN
jgi:hypothetical protein